MQRADHDSWDPSTGVGVTATFGAVARAVCTDKGLMKDPFAEPLVRAAGVEYFTRLVQDHRYADDDVQNPITTGLLDMLAAHTRFLDEFLAAAGRDGIRQVVLVGSGLDTRAYRLWWPRETTVYELDRPGVLDFKSGVLRGIGATPTAHRCAIGLDLRRGWLTPLRRAGFDTRRPTVWIVEQLLLGHLAPDAHNRLLRDVTEASAAGSRLGADHLPTWSPSQLEAARVFVDGWRRQGLDVELAGLTYLGEYRYLPEHLTGHGWVTVERDIAALFAGLGMSGRWRTGLGGAEVFPGIVTATLR